MFDYISVKFAPSSRLPKFVTLDNGETWSGNSVRMIVSEHVEGEMPLWSEPVVEWFLCNQSKLLTKSERLVRLLYLKIEIIISVDAEDVSLIECRFPLRRQSNIELDDWSLFVASWPRDWELQIVDNNLQLRHDLAFFRDYIIHTPEWMRCAVKYNWNSQ